MKRKTAAIVMLISAFMAFTAWSADKASSPKASSREKVPSGYRGVGIPVAGNQIPFIQKMDRVDVLVTFDTALVDVKLEKVTATLLQNVLVADIKKPEKGDDKGAIELLVNPNEAQYLSLGLMQGVLSIAVRAPGDQEMKPIEMASFKKLFR